MKQKKMLNPIHKTMVIGLGGTGKETLVQVKRRLYEAGYDETLLQPYIKLLSLDFDPAPVKTGTLGEDLVNITLDTSEEAAISSAPIFERLKNLQEPTNIKYFENWYPDMNNTFIRMGAHRAGAAQWRPLGRLGYYEHVNRIQKTLERTLKALQADSADDTRQVNSEVVVYIVSSLSGGTGAGLLLDIAYFMRSLNSGMRIVGMFLLPGVYSEHDIQGRLFSNTYASLKELSAFMGQSHEFRANYPTGRPIKGQILKNSPFDLVFLHDSTLGPDRVASSPQTMAELIGESIYLEIGNSYLNQSQSSALTNMVQCSGGQALDDIAAKTFFNTMGNVTFEIPSFAELYEYWANKAIVDIFSPSLEGFCLVDPDRNTNNAKSKREYVTSVDGLKNTIERIKEDALSRAAVFSESFIVFAGKEMGMTMCNTPADTFNLHMEQYVKALLEPQLKNKGVMPSAPYHLPDNMLADGGGNTDPTRSLSIALEQVDEEIVPMLTAVQDSVVSVGQAKALSACLGGLITSFEEKAEKHRKKAKERITGAGGPLSKANLELSEFIGSVAPGVRQDALCHWAGRFFHKLSHIYKDHIARLRVYSLVAARLREILQDLKQSIESAERIRNGKRVNTNKLAEPASHELEKYKRACTNRSTLVLRSLATDNFLEKTWGNISTELEKKAPVFSTRFQEALQDNAAGMRDVYSVAKTVVFSFLDDIRGEFSKSSKARLGTDIFDLCGYIDYAALKSELGRARHDHFITNTVENESSHNMVYALLPTYGPASSKQETGVFYQRFRDCISNNMEAVATNMDTYSMKDQGDKEPGRIVVRHISMNHPSYNLRDISYYYSAYCKHGRHKGLAHIHKEYATLPEIVLKSQVERFATCGNPDCNYDITSLPRTELTCPECMRPILSRCGNPDCPEDHLHEHEAIKSGENRIFCPTCKKRIKTRWWYCNDHNIQISTESNYCKLCLQEYAAGKRYFEDVSKSEEVVPHFPCPGCLTTEQEAPFKVTFHKVYDEVKDEDVPEALKIYFSPKTPQGRCPKCSSLLLPVCPYHDPNDNETPHFVQRGEGSTDWLYASKAQASENIKRFGQPKEQFFCTSDQDHAQKCIRECSFCGMPLREDAKYCPRCQRKRDDEIKKIESDELKNEILERMNHHNQLYFGFGSKKNTKRLYEPQRQLGTNLLSQSFEDEESQIHSEVEPNSMNGMDDKLEALAAFEAGKEEGYGGQ